MKVGKHQHGCRTSNGNQTKFQKVVDGIRCGNQNEGGVSKAFGKRGGCVGWRQPSWYRHCTRFVEKGVYNILWALTSWRRFSIGDCCFVSSGDSCELLSSTTRAKICILARMLTAGLTMVLWVSPQELGRMGTKRKFSSGGDSEKGARCHHDCL